MEIKDLIKLAQQREKEKALQRAEPFFIETIAWFHYLGLLRHNRILPQRHIVTLEDALKAGALESRILELIPAILVALPQAIKYDKKSIPKDLEDIVKGIRCRKPTKKFRGVSPNRYLHWLGSPMMDIARRRLNHHRIPRRRLGQTHSIGEIIRNGRMNLALTQKQLAKKYSLSLRVIRDLEQGKLDASLKTTNEILDVFGRSLQA